MKAPVSRHSTGNSRRRGALFAALIPGAVLLGIWWLHFHGIKPAKGDRGRVSEAAAVTSQNAPEGTAAPRPSPRLSPLSAPGAPRPNANPAQAVTVGDGKDANSIRQWAHNELEVQRMLNENNRIYRRQLVTLKETVAGIVERNRLTGAQIHELTLPGLDGQEIKVEIRSSEISPSGQNGRLSGQVAGRLDSMVTLAFLNGREAYTILSPADKLYLDVEPHEPGDVIVKSINLEKYGGGLCGNP